MWTKRSNDGTFHQAYGVGGAAGSRERGYGSDGAETIFEIADATRIWARAFLRLAIFAGGKAESGIHFERAALQGRFGDSGAREFWLRVEPRTCALGDSGLWVSRNSGAELRGHFLQ